jgi:ABC-type multidrug transport system fused ATPase/permease subunit
VSFAYRPDQPVLDDVSFSVSPGETVALVGPSGAGKTTVVSVLGRLYEPSSGHVFVDDVDIATISLRKLREQIAIVPQDSLLLSGTIAENIQYGRLDATRAEVEQAAQQAGSGQFIAGLTRGFDTELGDLGAGLSGGERQRISIARAFLKDAPILILDEPTSSLDPLTERAILAAMRELRRHRTTFIIAHRMSTVRDADRIIVLNQGAVVAMGRHRELLQSSPLYRRLVEEFVDADSNFKTNT